MKKILLLGSQHGNELLGEKLYQHIKKSRPELAKYIKYKVANLKAKRLGVRYIESDMNRSYSCGQDTYEKRRAVQLIKYIKANNFDLVLDLHTTVCTQDPCIIVPSINKHIYDFLDASNIANIVIINMPIVKQSLIGSYKKSISVEISKDQLSSELLGKLADDIARFINKEKSNTTATIYQVDDFLYKNEISEIDAKELINFKLSKYGYYPILIGENSYKAQTNYLGFKSTQVKTYYKK